jgi:hypothetical protein
MVADASLAIGNRAVLSSSPAGGFGSHNGRPITGGRRLALDPTETIPPARSGASEGLCGADGGRAPAARAVARLRRRSASASADSAAVAHERRPRAAGPRAARLLDWGHYRPRGFEGGFQLCLGGRVAWLPQLEQLAQRPPLLLFGRRPVRVLPGRIHRELFPLPPPLASGDQRIRRGRARRLRVSHGGTSSARKSRKACSIAGRQRSSHAVTVSGGARPPIALHALCHPRPRDRARSGRRAGGGRRARSPSPKSSIQPPIHRASMSKSAPHPQEGMQLCVDSIRSHRGSSIGSGMVFAA